MNDPAAKLRQLETQEPSTTLDERIRRLHAQRASSASSPRRAVAALVFPVTVAVALAVGFLIGRATRPPEAPTRSNRTTAGTGAKAAADRTAAEVNQPSGNGGIEFSRPHPIVSEPPRLSAESIQHLKSQAMPIHPVGSRNPPPLVLSTDTELIDLGKLKYH